MIMLEHVSKRFRTRDGWNVILDDVWASLPAGVNIGILGRNGAGKSTLLRMLTGAEYADAGSVHLNGLRLSFPIGFSGGFVPTLPAADNVRFFSRVYGADWRKVMAFVADFAELGDYLKMPVESYSSGMKSRLAFALSLAIDFDCYLIDEGLSAGDYRFRARAKEVLEARKQRSNLILVSHNPSQVRAHCDVGYVLQDGKLRYYDRVEAAMEAYEHA